MAERLTREEYDEILRTEFGGDERLALAFGIHCRAILAGRLPESAHAEPIYSSMASDHGEDGSERVYACIASHKGLVAVYRLRANGRFVRMKRWPAWIVANDREPWWRERCRRIHASEQRRRRRRSAKLLAWVASLKNQSWKPPVVTEIPTAANDDTSLEEVWAELERMPAA